MEEWLERLLVLEQALRPFGLDTSNVNDRFIHRLVDIRDNLDAYDEQGKIHIINEVCEEISRRRV